ncbi:hypothetical protein RQM65_08170 [Pricia sp. S334]|uniref:Uncharacterized protein n=1 Tax=Pricia mediterranea TaxID=3076079 RepID=A0ABU3L4N7_9FLAO|nr:hypothetical protein [Pricia sp. S334]MDT7828637.1 hypothetical protein [Pricia sp. S334]
MKTNRKYLYPGLLGLLILLILGGYLYLNRSHRNIAEEEARFTVTTAELVDSFGRSGATSKIADQVIETKGKITALDEKSVTLDKKVEVSFAQKLPPSIDIGMEVTVKGRCVGYDDLLQRVKVDQAMLIEPL